MLKLYHHHTSVCAAKTRLVLAEKGLDFDGEIIRLRERDQHRPEYLAKNPFGLVPMLEHDGKVVVESNVINEYLDDVFPDPALRPTDPFRLAQMRTWTRMTDENIHAAAGVVTGGFLASGAGAGVSLGGGGPSSNSNASKRSSNGSPTIASAGFPRTAPASHSHPKSDAPTGS